MPQWGGHSQKPKAALSDSRRKVEENCILGHSFSGHEIPGRDLSALGVDGENPLALFLPLLSFIGLSIDIYFPSVLFSWPWKQERMRKEAG